MKKVFKFFGAILWLLFLIFGTIGVVFGVLVEGERQRGKQTKT